MSYMHIENLYVNKTILQFKELYALEKIHGTSAHISWNKGELRYSPGGCKLRLFQSLFNEEDLIENFKNLGHDKVVVYGEQYGGKMQGMSNTYGKQARFTVFEVAIGGTWLNVLNAADVASKLGLEFVHYTKIPCTIEAIDAERDAPSVQAERCGMGTDKVREGVVLRPIHEFVDNRGKRVIAKHKADKFKETRTTRKVRNYSPQEVLEGQQAAFEWVTDMRVRHVVDKVVADTGKIDISSTGDVVKGMLEDIKRESNGEVNMTKYTCKVVSSAAVKIFHRLLPEFIDQYS